METNIQGMWVHSCASLILTPDQALQLIEYLIKHGSERVVDDARSHISTIKMLRNFHYIDDKGKDEGVNGTFPYIHSVHSFSLMALMNELRYSPQSIS